MNDELLIPEEGFPAAHKVWLINELARTDNRVEIKNKYKRLFGSSLNDSTLAEIVKENEESIRELKLRTQNDIESHAMASDFKRIDELDKIKELAKDGVCVGVDAQGMPIYKVDLGAAINAIKAIGEVKQQNATNQLKLLQILLAEASLRKAMEPPPTNLLNTGARPAGSEEHLEAPSVDATNVKEIKSDMGDIEF